MGGRVVRSENGAALFLTLENAGRRNALSVTLLNDLRAALTAPMSARTRIVFIRGADGTFSAGADLNDISGTEKDADYDRLTAEIGDLIRACPLPVAALIEGPCMGAAVELAREWRTDRMLRRLEALLIVADPKEMYLVSGTGDVIAPDDGILAVGSGGSYALAAARALAAHTELDAVGVAKAGLEIAAQICVFTNSNIVLEEVS